MEEDRDLETISLVLSQNKHFLKFLFGKYANSTHSKKSEFFEELREKFERISLADLLRMFNEVHMRNIINKEQGLFLIKTINEKLRNKGNENALDFEGFSKFLVQISLNRFPVEKS
jgi:hypothetical protein